MRPIKPFQTRRANMKINLTRGEAQNLKLVAENPAGGTSVKELRRINRVCAELEKLTGTDEEKNFTEEELEVSQELEFTDKDWKFLVGVFESFSNWLGNKKARDRILSLSEKLEAVKE